MSDTNGQPDEARGAQPVPDARPVAEEIPRVPRAVAADGVPRVLRVAQPVPALGWNGRPAPRMGFWQAILACLAFGGSLYGAMAAIGIGVYAVEVVSSGDPREFLHGEWDQLNRAGEASQAKQQVHLPIGMSRAIAFSFCGAQYAVFAGLLLLLPHIVGRDWRRQLAVRRPPVAQLMLAVVGLPAFMVVSEVFGTVAGRYFNSPPSPADEEALKELFSQFPTWFGVLTVGLAPGLLEEFWCRGFLGRSLVGRFGRIDGVIFTSLVFGLLHAYPPDKVAVTACMGAMLHFTYLASRSIWIPILLHASNNGVSILGALGKLPVQRASDNATATAGTAAAAISLGLLLLLAVGFAMWSARSRIVSVEPGRQAWEPDYPGVALPPKDSGSKVVDPAPHWALSLLVVAALLPLAYLLGR